MDIQHEKRDEAGRYKGEMEEAGRQAICYVLMNSRKYGTEAWPCDGLDEAVKTLARLARAAEQRRREDGIQRYFCILGELPAQGQEAVCDPVSPDPADTDALTLTLHFRDTTKPCRESEAVPCLCRFVREAKEVAA